MEPSVQYGIDKRGRKTVSMSAKEWEAFRKKHRQLQNKLRFIQELKESAKEIKLIMQGKKKGKPLSELVNELQD